MHYQPMFALLLLPWLAVAANGVTPLSQQQPFLNHGDQQWQQQRILNNQQMEQRRQQQGYELKMNQPKMLSDNPGNNPMRPMNTNSKTLLQNGGVARNPFNNTAPVVPQVPLPATPSSP
ncbi:hypothetical protein FHU10_1706 [Serratia fonticola]|jgi:hypothetical protein|uniref:DUF2756 family protein n=1 Tax=Serratia fonticola TaxID=47917 RepID=A0A542CV57_SERFO|nr:hypothetical protein [Serratia fonticola]TQI78290.1 hypothetical protein FHU09_0745 [Serratia fonticola]TQI94712.1 hypothetical protein FHU11_0046 [Serratia fonticola]TVZ69211.1 hypothetical protein FHU10_1706 [Serratia fonticola]